MSYNFESQLYIIDALETVFKADNEQIDWFFRKLDRLELRVSYKQLQSHKAKNMLLEGQTVLDIAKELDIPKKTVYNLKYQLFNEVINEQ